jgi:hypothetical protein
VTSWAGVVNGSIREVCARWVTEAPGKYPGKPTSCGSGGGGCHGRPSAKFVPH